MSEFIFDLIKELIPVYIFIFITIYLQIIIHEGGHLIFGLLTKYNFLSFRIGNLMFLKTDGKLKLKKFSILGTGGQCIMIPPDFKDGKIPYVLYNAGGALLNFATSIFSIVMNIYFVESRYMDLFTEVFALFGIFLGLLNIIPFKGKFVSNDGKNILAISKSQNAMESFWRMLKVHALLNKGIRVKNIPDELIPKPSDEDLLNNITAIDGYTYAVKLLENHEFNEAKIYIENLLSKDTALTGLHKSILTCELIYCNLLDDDFEAIDKLMDKKQIDFLKKAKTMLPVLRVQYLLALLKDKDNSKAEEYLKKFEKLAKGYSVPVEVESEYELIEYAKSFKLNSSF